jgi:uncharacterized protein YlzI (FlbEa/FlbD family)
VKEQVIHLHLVNGDEVIVAADKISSRREANKILGDDVQIGQKTVIVADGQAYKVRETMEEVAALIAAVPE